MLIAVTGASGFIGGAVADRCAALGYEVTGFGRRPVAGIHERGWADYRRWDVRGDASGHLPRFDAVVHCAGAVNDWGPAELFARTNVEGTRRVLSALGTAGHFVHISSSSVYDPAKPTVWLREDAALGARFHSQYALSKRRAEAVISSNRPGATILRPHAVYGVGDPTLLPRLLRARLGRRQLAAGDGSNRLSVTHVDNLVEAVVLAAQSRASGAFNVTDAVTPTLNQLLTVVGDSLGGGRVVHVPERAAMAAATALEFAWRFGSRVTGPPLTRYAVEQMAREHTFDTARAASVLGCRPRRSFAEAVPEAVEAELARHAANAVLPLSASRRKTSRDGGRGGPR